MDTREAEPRAERVVDVQTAGLSVTQIVAVDRRLERARDQEQSGAERMEGGTRLPCGRRGRRRVSPCRRAEPSGWMRRRATCGDWPTASAAGLDRSARAGQHPGGLPRVGGECRVFGWPTSSSACWTPRSSWPPCERGTELDRRRDRHRGTVRVIGVSGRGDRRLLDSTLPSGSDLARVSRGEVTPSSSRATRSAAWCRTGASDPGPSWSCRCARGNAPSGGVAIWLPGGREPSGGVRAEILAALGNAGPRVVTALEADKLKEKTRLDPLTGLLNRRGSRRRAQPGGRGRRGHHLRRPGPLQGPERQVGSSGRRRGPDALRSHHPGAGPNGDVGARIGGRSSPSGSPRPGSR